MRAGLLGQTELRKRLEDQLNGGEDGWNYDEPAVVEAACELAVRDFFPPDVDVREITQIALAMQAASTRLPGALKIAAVIRAALGNADVGIDDINPPQLMHIRAAVVGYLFINLGAGFS